MGVVILSTLVFILSTMPELTDDIDMIPLTNTTDSHQSVERWEDVSKEILMQCVKMYIIGKFERASFLFSHLESLRLSLVIAL